MTVSNRKWLQWTLYKAFFSAIPLIIIFLVTCRSQNGTTENERIRTSESLAGRKPAGSDTSYGTGVNSQAANSIPKGLQKLLKAYPDFLDKSEDGYLIWKDGTRMLYDDGRDKSFEELLDSADLEDQMQQHYPAGKEFSHQDVNFDPGRIRHEPFLQRCMADQRRR